MLPLTFSRECAMQAAYWHACRAMARIDPFNVRDLWRAVLYVRPVVNLFADVADRLLKED